MVKIGRNQPCPCGSGVKYKRCCGDPLRSQPVKSVQINLPKNSLKILEAIEQNRIKQQGKGKPIISEHFDGKRVVAVGSQIYFSPKWAYFSDFLMDYIKKKLGEEWGKEEIGRSPEKRHPIIIWYQELSKFHQKLDKDENGHYRSEANGLINCYLGLAYNLYLLDHNAELQARYVERLKKPEQFQGAYYELIVAGCLIRAGFDLELEDESDKSQKHCEFSAKSKKTGKKYWVEAKMRAVSGVLGKTGADGQPATSKPTSRLSHHLREALKKPSQDARIVFIDVNTTLMAEEDFNHREPIPPSWMEAAEKQLNDRERNLADGQEAYVFVTNFGFHHALYDTFLGRALLAFGLGMEDFAKPKAYTFKEAWRIKQKHIDMFELEQSLRSYPQIPNQFDGDLPPVGKGERERIKIGHKYYFEGTGVTGEVTSAVVVENAKKIYVAVDTGDGKSSILTEPISDAELQVYREYPDTYFNAIQKTVKNIEEPFELFENLFETYRHSTKEKLLEFMKNSSDLDLLKTLDQEDLALEYCERIAHAIMRQRAQDKKAIS